MNTEIIATAAEKGAVATEAAKGLESGDNGVLAMIDEILLELRLADAPSSRESLVESQAADQTNTFLASIQNSELYEQAELCIAKSDARAVVARRARIANEVADIAQEVANMPC